MNGFFSPGEKRGYSNYGWESEIVGRSLRIRWLTWKVSRRALT